MPPFVALPAALVACVASMATPDLTLVEPRLDRGAFTQAVAELGTVDDARAVLEMLFASYADGLVAAAEQTERAVSSAGGERIDQALAGRLRLDPAELRELRVAVVHAESAGWEAADAHLEELIANVEALVADADPDRLALAACRLRREAWLAPRRTEADDPAYAGDGVDLVRLFDEQRSLGTFGEIDPAVAQRTLDDYARRLDELLRTSAAADRADRLALRAAQAARDTSAAERAEKALLARWRPLHALTIEASARVAADLQAAASPAAAAAWTDTVDRAIFPWLFEASSPERAAQWIVSNRTLDETVRGEAQRILAAHRAQAAEVTREMTDLLLKARLGLGRIVTPRSDPASLPDRAAQDVLRDLLRASGRRAVLDDETGNALAALLTERQRAAMRADLAARAFGRRK